MRAVLARLRFYARLQNSSSFVTFLRQLKYNAQWEIHILHVLLVLVKVLKNTVMLESFLDISS